MKSMKIKKVVVLLIGLCLALSGKAQESASASKVAVGLRTNLVTWTLGAPGIGVDIRFADCWQVGIDGAYGGWDLSEDSDGVRVTTAGVQVRRYFRPFGTQHVGADMDGDGVHYTSWSHGWFVGLDARYTHYNDQFFIHTGGTEGDALTAGLIGGYSFALSRDGRWGVDALLGLGFVHKTYDKYEWYAPVLMNRFIGSGEKNKFGLTTAEVSITYKF